MDNDLRAWLFDINSAIEEIDSYFPEGKMKFDDYKNDLKTKRAVERNLEIIGEAVKRLLGRDESIALSNSRKIIDARNRISHGYDTLSDDVIWGIILNHLPKLKSEVERLLY